jgi:hypothetical protein
MDITDRDADHLDAVAISDAELTAMALSADPDAPLDPAAVPLDLYLGTSGAPFLPAWYMAPAAARLRGRVTRLLVLALVASFVIIEAFGLCSTYGQPPIH